jgi:hypothetical protein
MVVPFRPGSGSPVSKTSRIKSKYCCSSRFGLDLGEFSEAAQMGVLWGNDIILSIIANIIQLEGIVYACKIEKYNPKLYLSELK